MMTRPIKHIILLLMLSAGFIPADATIKQGAHPTPERETLHRHIGYKMPLTVRTTPVDTLGNFALPKPFSVPCISGGFQNMFYWDTYFTNAGLLLDGDIWQARNNIEDIAALINRFGYMPNASCKGMLNRSQPPFFSQMVKDYYNVTGNKEFLASLIPTLEKEYEFWMTQRIAPNGLNTYGHNATPDQLSHFFHQIAGRVGMNPANYDKEQKEVLGAHFLAEAESGWDFNRRYNGRCMDYNPIDLNSLLYGFERNMAEFLTILNQPGAKDWTKRADKRAKLMRKYMLDPKTKLFYDYDYTTEKHSDVFSAGSYVPLWLGLATKAEAKAALKNLGRLEGAHGIQVCEPSDKPVAVHYQWDAPNGWAPTTYFVIKGLDRYGFKDDAYRIADKYVEALTGIYGLTNQLWEKYNAVEGNNNVNNEYAMPGEFMGWTAGTYQMAYNYLYGSDARTDAPRVVNIIDFIRFTEPRRTEIPQIAWITDSVLLTTVENQINFLNQYGLKSTFLIQYDALIDPQYQQLLKTKPCPGTEIGGWWEITQPHVEAAGLKWRGRYPWDWYANVGFSTGYTPDEREKLVDVYMDKFKEVFGEYPKSVGSWFIDSHSLKYMRDKYGIEASTSCRDQLGTDGYNLWGGYWQGGYYPSTKNFYIPAQTKENQIDVPTFRMLGSDPIAQYDCGLGGKHQSVVTLEPVYGNAGGNHDWVNWYFDKQFYDPAMNLSYLQAGQENMFTWHRMKHGLTYQWPLIARLAQKGDIKVQTLLETARDFRKEHKMTPPSAISCMDGFGKDKDKKTIWFNCRNYRLNLMWEGNHMFVRDIHLFDENQQSLYLNEPCTTPACHYWTLPLVDGNVWSNDSIRGCMRFYAVGSNGTPKELLFDAPHQTNDGKTLKITIPVQSQPYQMVITLDENAATFNLEPTLKNVETPRWFAAIENAPEAELPFGKIDETTAKARYRDYNYTFNVVNAVLADRRTAPRNAAGALTALTITPEKQSFTIKFQ